MKQVMDNPNTMSNLKVATEEDIPKAIELGELFFKESKFSLFSNMDTKRTTEALQSIIQSNGKEGVVLLAEDSKEVVGMVVAVVTTLPFGIERVAAELAWYIHPDHRSSRLGLKLLEAYEYWAEHIAKCQLSTLALIQELDPEGKVEQYYKRKGYVPAEKAFIKRFK